MAGPWSMDGRVKPDHDREGEGERERERKQAREQPDAPEILGCCSPAGPASLSSVVLGPDPRIHATGKAVPWSMDGRVKPDHDGEGEGERERERKQAREQPDAPEILGCCSPGGPASLSSVILGPDPRIRVTGEAGPWSMDGRVKSDHDGEGERKGNGGSPARRRFPAVFFR